MRVGDTSPRGNIEANRACSEKADVPWPLAVLHEDVLLATNRVSSGCGADIDEQGDGSG